MKNYAEHKILGLHYISVDRIDSILALSGEMALECSMFLTSIGSKTAPRRTIVPFRFMRGK